MSRVKYTPQEALNLGINAKQEWGNSYSMGDVYNDTYKYFSRWSESNKVGRNASVGRTYTTVNGSADVTMSGDDHFPKIGQLISGTGIDSGAICIARPSFSKFTMDKVATASGSGVTDIDSWDQDPSEATSTLHLDVTDSPSLVVYCNEYYLITFTTTPTDIQKFTDGFWWKMAANNDASWILPRGSSEIQVPQLGPKIYFNFIVWKKTYNDSNYIGITAIGGDSRNLVF
jgi:hypothetical protein